MLSFFLLVRIFPTIFVCFYPILLAAEVTDSFYHIRVFAMRTQCRASHLMISFIDNMVYIFLNAVRIKIEFFLLTTDRLRRFFKSNLMIAAVKKTPLKEKSEVEMLLTEEDSERFRSTSY